MFEKEIIEKLLKLEKEIEHLKRIEGASVITDHGELTGLSDNDHPQYALEADVVHNTGNESIAGVKTFGSIPVLPSSNPTLVNQAVRKGYIDTFVHLNILETPVNIFSAETTSSNISSTKIDLSTYGLPAGMKAIWTRITAKDSASYSSTYSNFALSHNGSEWQIIARTGGRTNNSYVEDNGICKCDANGDVYYQVQPSGTTTYYMKVHGYWK